MAFLTTYLLPRYLRSYPIIYLNTHLCMYLWRSPYWPFPSLSSNSSLFLLGAVWLEYLNLKMKYIYEILWILKFSMTVCFRSPHLAFSFACLLTHFTWLGCLLNQPILWFSENFGLCNIHKTFSSLLGYYSMNHCTPGLVSMETSIQNFDDSTMTQAKRQDKNWCYLGHGQRASYRIGQCNWRTNCTHN